ncbi:hypothetical protein VOLCADRAFT_95241 [Volvox carteri f. nagariensis]|uniref:Gamma-soluble NSF attachment protein n=1 Tax=Volvox carteri f. nagariensis TaxID=3068 RepID=D8U6Z5_VOLCA|nr:uncharacterized protein VOLCADRAFT_95241 [Volvox carteri f. nagariensis]EFJ44524.1 hypothetical protein VOLCADRAFT_95241 [Volvox carteri f. nagariensis]|eukprot:XP_002954374.1 hypothetical protein VOLCADRAFT_95241 [Volvox carteri f. nagariensis]
MLSAMNSIISKEKALTMEKEAKDLLKKAKGLTAPSLLELRFKPDWEAAAPMLDKAALLYKQLGHIDKALEAYERAAHAQERLGSQWHAAKHYEVIADLSRQQNRPKETAKYFKMAADYYLECGKPTTAGEVLTRGARVLEEPDPEEAVRLYYDALDVYESSEREAYAVDSFRAAASFLLRLERWADAVEVLMRFGALSDKVGARNTQNKSYLGAVVTWLWAGDAEAAWATFQDAMHVESFESSEEAFAADALFEVYRLNDEAAITSLVKSRPIFKQLDSQVARLAVRLPSPGSKIRRMARKLKRLMADPEDEEGEEEEGEGWALGTVKQEGAEHRHRCTKMMILPQTDIHKGKRKKLSDNDDRPGLGS